MAKSELTIIRSLLSAKVKELKLRKTAEWLNENLPKSFWRSHMTISNWIDGVFKPDEIALVAMKTYYPKGDPRHDAAVAIKSLRTGKSADWLELSWPEGKKLLGVVTIRTEEDGTVIHE